MANVKTSQSSNLTNLSANELKKQGNALFGARKYKDAIACYSKAIIRDPGISTYYTNRALCYLKLKQWDLACQDCQRAIDNDQSSIKGHFFMGQALFELQYYDEAIASLTRALDLSKDQRQCFGDDITGMLRLAKKRKWSLEEDRRIKQEVELQSYLNSLIVAEKDRQIEQLREKRIDDNIKEEIEEIENNHAGRLKEVDQMFSQIDERRQKLAENNKNIQRDVPDAMCSRISFGVMRDPVITPSGITYERKDIVEHLQRLGHFDPVTRKDLSQDQLIPNLAMKEIIDQFLQDNPWAEDY